MTDADSMQACPRQGSRGGGVGEGKEGLPLYACLPQTGQQGLHVPAAVANTTRA